MEKMTEDMIMNKLYENEIPCKELDPQEVVKKYAKAFCQCRLCGCNINDVNEIIERRGLL